MTRKRTDCATPAAFPGRLILSQNTEGWWDASPNTAFVLESRAAVETQHLPATLFSRVMTIMGGVAEAVIASNDADLVGDDDREGDSTLDDVLSEQAHAKATKDGVVVDESLSPEEAAASHTPRAVSLRRTASMTRAANITDCPLTCSVSAITSSMPRRLSALRAVDASIAVRRVWTTLCCISVLERMNASWIWGDGCVRAAACACVRVCALLASVFVQRSPAGASH
jgi:hypothetical protein